MPVDPSWPPPPPPPSSTPPAPSPLGWAPPSPPAASGPEHDPFRAAWAAPPPATRGGRGALVAVVVVAVLVVGLAGAGLASLVGGQRARAGRQAAAATSVQAALPRLEAFVAHDTGRPWRHAVTATVLDDPTFLSTLADSPGFDTQQPASDQDDTGVTYAGMGLVGSPHAYWDASSAGVQDGVTGFYDPNAATLYVRGSSWTPALEDTLVHELTHANQDQSYGLAALMGRTSTVDESPTVLQAVAEGEATVVEKDYYRTQPPAWQASVDQDDASFRGSGVAVADAEAAFPYTMGESFVTALRAAGGTAAVDRAFTGPPRWSRDLADPRGWLAGRLPTVAVVARPPLPSTTSGEVADIGVLGERGLWLAVAGSGRADPGATPDLSAVSGWAGDTYVASDRSYDEVDDTYAGPYCFVDDMTFVDTAARSRALDFVRPWVSRAGVTVALQGDRAVRLSRCSGA